MSIERIKPGRGIWVKCDGTDDSFCKEKRYTGNIVPKHNRAHWARTEGWGRGLRSHSKAADFCPTHMDHERKVVEKIRAERAAAAKKQRADARAAAKKQRADARAAKLAAKLAPKPPKEPKPKKPRRSKGSAASPSADSHPAPAS